jgi:hypothetical protein
MLIELLSMSNYGNYNIKVAQILGLETAVYLNELMNINEKAVRKKKIDDNIFIVDRQYIQSRTTIEPLRQEELETNLIKLGILEKTDKSNNINLNITALTSILAAPEEDLKGIAKIAKKTKNSTSKSTKTEQIVNSLKGNIVTTNEELNNAYSEWIEAVVAKVNWMSKKAVVAGQQQIDEFANRNLDVALKVIEIATINGYADMSWAINSYKRNYSVPYQVTPTILSSSNESSNTSTGQKPKLRLSTEVF